MIAICGCGKQPIATVGEHKITRTEFIDKLEQEQGRDALLGMIHQQLLEAAFEKSGLTVSQEEIDEQLQKIRDSLGTPEAFSRWMKSQGWSEEDLLERITMELKVKALCMKDVKVSDKAVEEFFNKYRDRFHRPELVTYSEIVVTADADAKKIAAEAKKNPADFAKLAKQHSIATASRERGGQLQPMARAQIYPAPVQAALGELKSGQVSNPLSVDGRWYVVKLDKVEPERDADLKKDRKEIEETFKMQSAKQPAQLLEELRKGASVTVLDPKYKDVEDMFTAKAEMPTFGERGAGAQGGEAPAAGAGAAEKPAAGGKGQ